MVKKQKRTLNIVLAIVGVLFMLIILLVLLYSGTFTKINIALNSQSIKNEQRNARSALEGSFDLQQNRRIQTLYDAGVITSPTPTYSAKIDSCFFVPDVVGKFNVTDWKQNCSLRYIDFMETSLTREEILQKLSLNPQVSDLFGIPYIYEHGKDGKCDPIYQVDYSPSLHFQDWSRNNNLLCKMYEPSSASKSHDGNTKINLIRSYDLKDVSTDKSYLLINEETDYFSKSLGCGALGLFGCGEPVKEPITDF